jgi:hypothetical protein
MYVYIGDFPPDVNIPPLGPPPDPMPWWTPPTWPYYPTYDPRWCQITCTNTTNIQVRH